MKRVILYPSDATPLFVFKVHKKTAVDVRKYIAICVTGITFKPLI